MRKVIEASKAVAIAVKLCRPKVCPMYPITPSTHIPEDISNFVSDGELDSELVLVESEHSAMSAVVGAAAAGARTFTATASQGLALMFEMLPIVSGMRLPAVMAVGNRALSAPINIWNDHSDSVSARDQGWVQLYVESSQEALDTVIQAYKIAEAKDVLLPVMVCLDGFSLTHVYEPVEIPEQKDVDRFLPAYKPKDFLDVENPKTFGPIGFPSEYMEFRMAQQGAMAAAAKEVSAVNREFGKAFGRKYGDGFLELYRMQDAEYAVACMGTIAGTAKVAVDEMRKKGIKAGLVRVRCLRPFPDVGLRKAVKGLKGLAVLDRHISLGYEGPLYTDIRSAVCGSVGMSNYIAGLGGRDVTLSHFEKAFTDISKGSFKGGWLL